MKNDEIALQLVGGIYGMSSDFRSSKLQETTETLLESRLTDHGFRVMTDRHRWTGSIPGDVDLVHVHHLAKGCVRMLHHRQVPMVFTRHATKPLAPHHSLVLAATLQRAQAVVALSEVELQMLPERIRAKTHVIYNGCDASVFTPLLKQPRQDVVQLLYVGQLIELKRVHLAIDFLSRCRARGAPARLTIVTHRDPLLHEILRHARDLGVEDYIEVHRGLPKARIAALMQHADVLVQPSRTEALSTVVTEACLVGLPVLAFNVGGMTEQLPQAIQPPAPNEVSAWMELGDRIVDDLDTWQETFRRHTALTQRRFSIASMVQQHAHLYRRVLQDAG